MRYGDDGCGCFPTGKNYPGIAHLLQRQVRGLASEWDAELDIAAMPIAMLDVETTGFDATSERVIELGIVRSVRGQIVSRHNWMINPGKPIPPSSTAVHGITDDDVKDKPAFAAVAAEIAEAMAGAWPAAYNADFDKGFVLQEFQRAGIAVDVPALRRDVQWLDPLVWARHLYASEKSKKLGDIAALLGVELENAHRASDDAEAALKVWFKMTADPRVPTKYGALVTEQRAHNQAQSDARRTWRS